MTDATARSRTTSAAILLTTIALGLGSRRHTAALPPLVATYAGDVLWAGMVFWLGALLAPRAPTTHLAIAAFTIAVAVELSQLYRPPWLDAIRATRGGALVLGQGFLWSDLVCYAAGVAGAALLDRAIRRPSHGAAA